ncbi:MAG: HWE histidine kinase domain-containing protein, partial [Pseudomonadota bacterium]
YDRVMIYRFHNDDSGEVIAEDKRADLDPYLGLRYPSSDIPRQARSLFVRNRFRIIAHMDMEPVPIESACDGQVRPLDLSMSVLRSHSRIHVQYMKNMGVAASIAIAIVRQGKLWGLISCHHYTPKLVPYSLRSVAEMLSQMFSMTLDRLLIERSETLRTRSQELHDMLMRRMAQGAAFPDDLDAFASLLGELIAHDGISVLMNDDYKSIGNCPSSEQFLRLLPTFNASPDSPVLAASTLAEHVSEASEFADIVAGALILPISRPPRDYIVLWRKPLTRTVRWAGNPAKAVIPGEDRLEPRSSFAAWAETVEGRSEEWSDSDLTIAEQLRITLLEVILRMTDEVAQERKRAREQQDLLIAELNHRVRNILNLIRSLVSQSTKDAADIADFTTNINGRIAALAKAHDNITRQNWTPAPLASLFESEMEAYLSGKKDRLRLVGEQVLVQPEAYTALALVVHELVTNSAKYGSLCDSKGTIDVEVGRAINGDLLINWTEHGGPPVQPPKRRGFGTTIIRRIIPHDLRGDAELNFKLAGLEAQFRVPARYVASPADAEAMLQTAANYEHRPQEQSANQPVPEHVLLVEDNMIIALDTEDGLMEAGVKSVSVESSVTGALAAIEKRPPDFAIVDFNLGSESSSKVAEELTRRGIRFVLATGYSELNSDLEALGAEGLMRKPYGTGDIEQALFGEVAN